MLATARSRGSSTMASAGPRHEPVGTNSSASGMSSSTVPKDDQVRVMVLNLSVEALYTCAGARPDEGLMQGCLIILPSFFLIRKHNKHNRRLTD